MEQCFLILIRNIARFVFNGFTGDALRSAVVASPFTARIKQNESAT